jgi:hypothetical protein
MLAPNGLRLADLSVDSSKMADKTCEGARTAGWCC